MSELITQNTFNVRIQKQDLEQVIKLADLLVQEITITIDPEGLTIRTMDPSHVALLDIALPNSLFEKYEVNNQINFGIRTKEVLDLVKEFDKNDSITMRIDADNNLILENRELSYSVRLIESVENNCPLPKIPYDSLVTIPGNDLKKYLGKLNVVSEHLTISTDIHICLLESKGDPGVCKIKLEKGMEQLIEIVTKQNSSSTYSLEYLLPYFKTMLSNCSHQLEFSSQKPLRVNSKIFNTGRVHFYLAPRVEN